MPDSTPPPPRSLPGSLSLVACGPWDVVKHTSPDVVRGEYRGMKYMIAPRAPYSGIGWSILWQGRPPEDCSGAFYDDCEDHPEGAYAWAESAVRKRIDRIHLTVAEFDALCAARRLARAL